MKTTTDERLSRAAIEQRILRDAIDCGSAARYIWPEVVEDMIAHGLLVSRSEHSAAITDAGRVAFLGRT
jgi:hypothetical protein